MKIDGGVTIIRLIFSSIGFIPSILIIGQFKHCAHSSTVFSLVKRLCGKILVMHNGDVVEAGETLAIFQVFAEVSRSAAVLLHPAQLSARPQSTALARKS